MRIENKREAAQRKRIEARFPNKRVNDDAYSSRESAAGLSLVIQTPTTVWDGFTFMLSAFIVGGMAATILQVLNIGVGHVPSWVMGVVVTILAATGIFGMRIKNYRGIVTGIVAVSMTLALNFFYTIDDGGESDGVFQAASRLVVYMPLLGALIGLLTAYVDFEFSRSKSNKTGEF